MSLFCTCKKIMYIDYFRKLKYKHDFNNNDFELDSKDIYFYVLKVK